MKQFFFFKKNRTKIQAFLHGLEKAPPELGQARSTKDMLGLGLGIGKLGPSLTFCIFSPIV